MKKLTPVQEKVMQLVNDGLIVSHDGNGRIMANGIKICNLQTVIALEDEGLIVKIEKRRWKAAKITKDGNHE